MAFLCWFDNNFPYPTLSCLAHNFFGKLRRLSLSAGGRPAPWDTPYNDVISHRLKLLQFRPLLLTLSRFSQRALFHT